ncbi:O-antigen ligase family protein [Oxobacter pfennigii]|nr:O-antigen ligase family protein [Oxobacter pfennigii]
MGIYLHNYFTETEKIESLMYYILIFSGVSAVIAIIEKCTAAFYKYVGWGQIFGIPKQFITYDGYRVYSTFGNPNIAGTWFAAVILISLYFFGKHKGFKKALFFWAVCFFTCVFILTGSRGAVLGLLPALIVYGLMKKDKWTYNLTFVIFIIIAGVMFVTPALMPQIHSANSPMIHAVNNSISSREAIWQGCLNMFKYKPLTGYGLLGIYSASKNIFHQYHRTLHGHNIIITLAATLGIVGLGIYLFIKKYIAEGLYFLSREKCDLAPLLAGIQVIILGHGLVDFTIMVPQIGMLYLGSLSIINSLVLQYSNYNEGIYIFSPWFTTKRTA